MTNNEKSFLEELLDLVRMVEHPIQDTAIVKAKLYEIDRKYKELENKDSVWNILDQMCEGITKEYFIMLEYLYSATHDQEVLNKQMEVLAKGLYEGSVDLFYALFYKWQFSSRIFLSHSNKFLFNNSSKLHKALLCKAKEFLQVEFSALDLAKEDTNRVVVSITQLLGEKHGPTRNALDYCYTLQKKLNKEVFLLVASEVPSVTCMEYHTYQGEYVYFNYNDSIEGDFCIEYMGEKIYGYQCRFTKESTSNVSKIISDIYEWRPYLIYNIGGDNLISNICGEFIREVSIPCGNVFPITEAKYQILPRKIEVSDKEILEYLAQSGKKVIESIFVYKLDDPIKKLEKRDFGFLEDAYVVGVVGNRLAIEVGHEFIFILREILEIDASINIAFMGKFDDYDEKKKIIGYEDRVKFLGMQSDLRGAYHSFDLYLNPPRRGGGTSAVEALAEGIPVISLPSCDVAYSCGEDFICAGIEDMPKLVYRYMTDKEFYGEQSRKAILQADKVVDTEAVLREILTKIESLEK